MRRALLGDSRSPCACAAQLLLRGLILSLAAAPASAGQCVFYLKASTASFEARVYDPDSGKDRRALPGRIPTADVLWDHSYEKIYWLDGHLVKRAWWLGKGKAPWPVPLPEELGKPYAWWLDWRGLKVVRRDPEKLELWEHVAAKKTWRMFERERLLEPATRDRQASSVLYDWNSRRRDKPLQELLAGMQGNSHLHEIRWNGTRESGTGWIAFYGQDGCGLRVQVTRDDAGAHVVAPLYHWCEKQEKGTLIFGEPDSLGFAPVSFGEASPWLLVGGEPSMNDPKVLKLKNGAVRKTFPVGATHAVWIPCPR